MFSNEYIARLAFANLLFERNAVFRKRHPKRAAKWTLNLIGCITIGEPGSNIESANY